MCSSVSSSFLRPGATLRLHLLVDVAKMLLHHGHAVRVFLRVALDVLQLTLLGADRRVERAVLGVGAGGGERVLAIVLAVGTCG